MDDADEEPVREGFLSWWILSLIVLAIWVVATVCTFLIVPQLGVRFESVDLSKTGTFGDTFGAVNSLFSALGVAGVAYALILQFREQRAGREAAIQSKKEAETNRGHDAELAMIAALINANAAMMEYRMGNYRHTSDMILHHQDKIDPNQMSNALNEQAELLMDSYRAIERWSKIAEAKLRGGLEDEARI